MAPLLEAVRAVRGDSERIAGDGTPVAVRRGANPLRLKPKRNNVLPACIRRIVLQGVSVGGTALRQKCVLTGEVKIRESRSVLNELSMKEEGGFPETSKKPGAKLKPPRTSLVKRGVGVHRQLADRNFEWSALVTGE